MKLISAILFACGKVENLHNSTLNKLKIVSVILIVAAVALLHSVYGTTLPISASDAVPEPGPESKPKTEPFSEPQAAPNGTVGKILNGAPFDNEEAASNVTVGEMISAEALDNEEAAARIPAIMPPLPSSFVELSAIPDPSAKSPAPFESNAYVGSLDDMVQDMTAETSSN